LRDPAKVKDEVLRAVLESSSQQLEQAAKNIEEIRSILHRAKSPRERTTVNVILDDQKKVAKALGRLVDDLSEICSQPV
jgi:anion-transporting  ArsA/GET3 family ATPase